MTPDPHTAGRDVTDLADEGLAPGDRIDPYLERHLEPGAAVVVPLADYRWDGEGLDPEGGTLVGTRENGEQTTLRVGDGARVHGWFEDCEVRNLTVAGENGRSKAGFYLAGGATVSGVVWVDGARRDEDRAFYTPSGVDAPNRLVGCCWARAMNNGAYVDKAPATFVRCAALNNNIAGIRVGDRAGVGGETVLDRCLVACTERPPENERGLTNARGLRLRQEGHVTVRDSWFVYADGYGSCVEIHDGAVGDSSLTFAGRIHFHREGGGRLIDDKTGGAVPVRWDDATVTVSGDGDYDWRGCEPPEWTEIPASEAGVPTPSALTGVARADDAGAFEHDVFDLDAAVDGEATP